jgi:hypothetical protein
VGLGQLLKHLFMPFDFRAVERRAYELLDSHLTDSQRANFRELGRFEVTGGDTGSRYVVRNLTSINIDELDLHGKCVMKWCFVPKGKLAQGDVLLAQKLALECFESEALSQARAFTPQNCCVIARQ